MIAWADMTDEEVWAICEGLESVCHGLKNADPVTDSYAQTVGDIAFDAEQEVERRGLSEEQFAA